MVNIMNMKKNIRVFLILLFFICIIGINYNIIINGHFHSDGNDHFYFHAHPYSKENTDSPLNPKHTHNRLEILYYSQIIKILCVACIFLLILIIPTKAGYAVARNDYIPILSRYLLPLRRGPPSYLITQ